jgi:indolepyruvate decarboxylase
MSPHDMPMGQFLFSHLHARGVRHCFGVPGDFALPTFSWLDRSPIQNITMTHEPGAGFAADAYARLNGIGLVCVTYCVGGLNVLNAIAGAYAEKSPVVVVSGAPGRADREKDPLLHHKVKTFETQRRVYDEVTVASTVLLDEQRAAGEIVRCVDACLRHKRPVYIEVPHDMVDRVIPTDLPSAPVPSPASDELALREALNESVELINAAKRPVILAGVELQRFKLADKVIALAEATNIPIAATLLSKATIPENHPLYLGVYGGAMSSDAIVRDYVESADCVLMLGTFITDMNMGIYTAKLDRNRVVLATTESLRVRHHRYENVEFGDFLDGLAACGFANQASWSAKPQAADLKITRKTFAHPNLHAEPQPLIDSERSTPLTMPAFFRILSLHLDERCCVIADTGDAIFGAVGIRTATRVPYIAPAYYLSMGFAVPAAVGVAAADPSLRPFVLVGDGAFQMTGTELSTAARLGQRPIVLILNNAGYGTMRRIRDGKFNVISNWNYGKVCDLIGGGEACVVTTIGELDAAITRARATDSLQVIEVRIPRDDMSPQLASMSVEVAKMRGTRTEKDSA